MQWGHHILSTDNNHPIKPTAFLHWPQVAGAAAAGIKGLMPRARGVTHFASAVATLSVGGR